MYEASHEAVGGFHHETVYRMRELFDGRRCSVCAAPAGRLIADEFFCHEHYPKAQGPRRSARVYSCHAPIKQ